MRLDILYVMAASQEYGPHLQARITPVMTGVGPVEAGVTVAAHLAELRAAERLPHVVVSLGSAGSATLEQGAVYQASSVSWRDMDASPLGFEPGVTPFLGLPSVLPLGHPIPGVQRASLSTGGDIVSGVRYRQIAADMVDMETYAVLRACQRFNVPLVALRGISDGREELRTLSDWTHYLHVVDENLAAAVDLFEAAVKDWIIP